MVDWSAVNPVSDYRGTLTNSANYAVNTWWAKKGYPASGIPTLANDEYGLRGAGCVALTLTTADVLGVWDADRVNVSVARAYAARLISAVARQHLVNTPGGWGGGWQTS